MGLRDFGVEGLGGEGLELGSPQCVAYAALTLVVWQQITNLSRRTLISDTSVMIPTEKLELRVWGVRAWGQAVPSRARIQSS